MIINPSDTRLSINIWGVIDETCVEITHTPTNTTVYAVSKQLHLAKEQAFKELQELLKDIPEQLELF